MTSKEWLCPKCTNNYEDRTRIYCGIDDACVSKMPPITECNDFKEGKKYEVEVRWRGMNSYTIIAKDRDEAISKAKDWCEFNDNDYTEIVDVDAAEV